MGTVSINEEFVLYSVYSTCSSICHLIAHGFHLQSINIRSTFSDDDSPDQKSRSDGNSIQGPPVGPNPFLETPQNAAAIEYKKGYVMRKCCYDSNNKKSECLTLRTNEKKLNLINRKTHIIIER